MKQAKATRHADGRYFYAMPCCTVNVGVLDDAVDVTCPACEARLRQINDTVTVETQG